MTNKQNSDFTSEIIRDGIAGSLVYAIVTGMSGQDIVTSFDVTFQAPYTLRSRMIGRLKYLCDQSPTNYDHVRNLITAIEEAAEQVPKRKQNSADATIAKLALALPSAEAEKIASSFVLHQRAKRRLSGYKLIKNLRDSPLTEVLTRSYSTYGDSQALVTLLAKEADISKLPDVRGAIAGLRERYHQALAIQRLLVTDRPKAIHLADDFPMAFIWAAGRLRDETACDFTIRHYEKTLHEIAELEKTHLAHDELHRLLELLQELRNLIWALGRVGALAHLIKLATKYQVKLPNSTN